MLPVLRVVFPACFFVILLLVGPARAQVGDPGLIDRDLRGNIDFRDVSFSECFEQPQCFAQGVTVTAERRAEDGQTWVSAQLYWDPIDGFGVMAGGQNDEIDFDERLIVRFEGTKGATVNIERVWLSDIFIEEDERYGNQDPAGTDDVEVAVIQSLFANALVDEAIVDGANVLPEDQFNAEVVSGFNDGGDLFRRVVIQGDVLTVVVPSDTTDGAFELVSFTIGQIDDAKLDLFAGIETVEIDLADILPEFNNVPFFAGGTENANIIQQALENADSLQAINQRASANRLASSVSNGELGVDMDETVDVETLIFMSVLGGSNDYSVAGIVLGE
jgi:hypothetical protein